MFRLRLRSRTAVLLVLALLMHILSVFGVDVHASSASAQFAYPSSFVEPNDGTRWTYVNNNGWISYQPANAWTRIENRGVGDYQDDVHATQSNGSYAEMSFFGTGIAYITELSPSQGEVDIYIDDVFQATVDCAGTWATQQTVFERTGLPQQEHTIKIVKRSGTYAIVDAFKIYYDGRIQVDDYSNEVRYSGTVSHSDQIPNALNQSQHWTTTAGDYAEFTFVGDSISYVGSRNTDHGLVDIYIDGLWVAEVDTYGPIREWRTELYHHSWPESDEHTIRIVAKNAKNSASTSIGFDLDALFYTSDPHETALRPLWQGDTIYQESALLVSTNGSPAMAPLLFSPTQAQILSVRDSRMEKEYFEGIDWIVVNGYIQRVAGSSIPYMNAAEFTTGTGAACNDVFKRTDGTCVLYAEGTIANRQILVSYEHSGNPWTSHTPAYAGNVLTGTTDKLDSQDPLKVVLYGDSITVGANASGFMNQSPYLPNWGDVLKYGLEKHYGSEVSIVNSAVGGQNSVWGSDNIPNQATNNIQTRVSQHDPDLVILAFGMNDGTAYWNGSSWVPNVSAANFKTNIEKMIDTVRVSNPSTEFILVGTMLPNPETPSFFHEQPAYVGKLQEIAAEKPGVAVAYMTNIHQSLLYRKWYRDMTGNNINHPNDFLSRWYAQYVLGMLIQS